MITDDSSKYDEMQVSAKQNDVAAPGPNGFNGQYNAYIDPSNPDDVVLSVPMNDAEFGDDQKEGVGNRNLNENGYLYGLADIYKKDDDSKEKDDAPRVARAPSTVTVSVALNEDDDDDFAERPRVQPASIGMVGIAPPPKTHKALKTRAKSKNKTKKSEDKSDLKAEPGAAIAVNGNGGPLSHSLLSGNADQPMIKNQDSGSLY